MEEKKRKRIGRRISMRMKKKKIRRMRKKIGRE